MADDSSHRRAIAGDRSMPFVGGSAVGIIPARTVAIVPAMLLLAAWLSLFTVDYPLSRWANRQGWSDEIHHLLLSFEPFGNPYGEAAVVGALLMVVAHSEAFVGRLVAGTLCGAAAANVIKLFVARSRPEYFDFGESSIWDSFQGIGPLLRDGSAKSFPSGHAASAFAFAVVLSGGFPRGRWLFFGLAALVGLQRIEASQHFASDVLTGAAVGWCAAHVLLWAWPVPPSHHHTVPRTQAPLAVGESQGHKRESAAA